LSAIGIPISLVMATVMTIVGIGWGRATRPLTVRGAVTGTTADHELAPGAITADAKSHPIGEPEAESVLDARELFNPRAVVKYISMWVIGPAMSTTLSYLFFTLFPAIA